MAERYDLAIVGGGPAGQAAAIALDGLGLDIIVIDEQRAPGGQILRQPPVEFTVRSWLPHGYEWLKAQAAQFERLTGVTWLGRHSVVDLTAVPEGFVLLADGSDGVRRIDARRVLIAGGCQDLAVPVPGWTLPGVQAAGGIQAFVKSQQIVAGSRIVFAGTHPLQLLIAAQVVAAGGTVAAVLFAQPRMAMLQPMLSHPLVGLRHAATLRPAMTAWTALWKAGVPVRFDATLTRIEGERGVTGVRIANCGEVIACDTVGLNYGFVPQSALARLAGASMRPAGAADGWAAVHDRWMRSSVDGLSVAGETVGVAGAPAAAAGGALAGLGIACDLGVMPVAEAARRAVPIRARHRRLLDFAALLDRVADPRPWFPTVDEGTMICRCEDVCSSALARELGHGSANSIKLVTRCGMGPCQGRNCEPTLLRMLAAAGCPDDPGFTQRSPVRPVSIASLADAE